MKSARKFIIIMMVLMLGICLLGGCTVARKPVTPTPQTTTPTPQTTNNTTQTTVEAKQAANRSVAEAEKVSGVNQATAVITGRTVYIGLDLNSNLEKSKVSEIEKNVLNRVKKIQPGYTVMVTSDVDTVTRIKKVSQGVAQGKPISSFTNELKNIGTRITPKTK